MLGCASPASALPYRSKRRAPSRERRDRCDGSSAATPSNRPSLRRRAIRCPAHAALSARPLEGVGTESASDEDLGGHNVRRGRGAGRIGQASIGIYQRLSGEHCFESRRRRRLLVLAVQRAMPTDRLWSG